MLSNCNIIRILSEALQLNLNIILMSKQALNNTSLAHISCLSTQKQSYHDILISDRAGIPVLAWCDYNAYN